MKKTNYLLSLFIIILFSCNYSAEINSNGISVVSNGIETTNHFLKIGDERADGTEFPVGTELNYILEGVKGFAIKDDKVLFGCSMTVTDKDKKVVLQYDDLFADAVEGYSREEASQLNLKLSIGSPMEEGKTYNWNVRLWDKRDKGDWVADIPLSVIAGKDLVGIKTKSDGLSCPAIYILGNGLLKTTKVKEGQKLTFVFSGVEGYELQEDSTMLIGASMLVRDKEGTNVVEYSDLFKDYGPVSPKQASTVSTYLTIGEPMKKGESYDWIIKVWDKTSNKSLESSLRISVE